MDSEEYLSVLNEEQKAAVIHDGRSLLILAGAGSGKTRVITTKIAYLIKEKHVDPYSILAVTFTKKAANEMRERAEKIEERARYAQIRTFHSFGAWFLRTHSSQAGVDKNFTVYDEDDMVTLVSKACPYLTRQQASAAVHKISLAKDYCLTPESDRLCELEADPGFPQIYDAYEKRLRSTGNVDFGDLIMLPYLVLRDNPLVRFDMQRRFRVIMVDEYQDSNVAQFLLLQTLSGVDENSGTYVCVVGDDDQSIYRFRGAEVQNILNFQKQFPGTDLIRLETNYRSTQEILECADNVVRNNEGRLGKTLVSARGKGKKPTLVFLPTQDDETDFCADLIEQALEKGGNYGDWAILYRTNAQSLGFETEFLHRKIPYQVVGSLKFYEREEIKDALAWIAFIANPRDEVSFRRIVNKPSRGIGTTSQDKIVEAGKGTALTLVARNVKLTKKAAEGIDIFCDIVDELSRVVSFDEQGGQPSELKSTIAKEMSKREKKELKLSYFLEQMIQKSGLEDFHRSQDEIAGTQKMANLQELVNSAVLYPCSMQGLLDFLDHIELDRTLEMQEEELEDRDRVTLITLHNTKGLEFKRVIISGMESGIFPREEKSSVELEEERRLFYVGITRAQNELYLSSCALRRLYGTTKYMSPSPFLNELGAGHIRVLGQKPAGFRTGNGDSDVGLHRDDGISKKWHVGAEVFHDDWGYGLIVHAAYSEDGNWVISVSFNGSGIKKFIPKYQKNQLILQDG